MSRKVNKITLNCKNCNKELIVSEHKNPYKERDYFCTHCRPRTELLRISKEERSNRMRETMKKISPEKRKENAKYARSKHKTSQTEILRKQHETIKNDPVKYEAYCLKRKQIAIDFHASMSLDDKQKHYEKVFSGKNISKAENDCFIVLENNKIVVERQKCIGGLFPDGVIENEKIIIEFFGDVYHCNPKIFSKKDQFCSWISRTVSEQWTNDKKRLAIFKKLGYKTLIIWESDWNNNQLNEIERIKNEMHQY